MSKQGSQKLAIIIRIFSGCLCALILMPPALAKKTNEAIYQDPYDLGGGGASLTRASQVGVLFANPALLAYGGKIHRWFGTEFTLITNKESVDTVRQIVSDARSGSEEASEDKATKNAEFVDKVFKDPVHLGWGSTLAWITKFGGIGVFSRFEPDIRARKIGSSGLPAIALEAESYHGAVASVAARSPMRWLSFGATAKYLYAAEPEVNIELTDEDKINSARDPGFSQDLSAHNSGVGLDTGMVAFFQGNWLDLSLAGKVDDVGNTKLSGDQDLKAFKQVLSAGAGLTLHSNADALHLALDYRDIQNVYEEPKFKRFYAGAKLTLRTYLGVAAGYYHGYPCYGAEVDLLLLRVSGTYYTRELSKTPGVEPRRLYMVSMSMGI